MSGVVFLDIVRHVVNDASSAACHDRLSEMEWKQVASKVVIKSQVPLFVFAAVNVNEQDTFNRSAISGAVLTCPSLFCNHRAQRTLMSSFVTLLNLIARPTLSSRTHLLLRAASPVFHPCSTSSTSIFASNTFHSSAPTLRTLNQAMRRKQPSKKGLSKAPLLDNNPHRKAIVMQGFTPNPKKPKSPKRKVARVRLTSGKVLQAYIPGEGHNLQEHTVVLFMGGRAQDLPGVR